MVVIFFVVLAAISSAATLADYRARLESSQKSIETIITVMRNGETGAEADSFIRQTVASVKKALPESETIDFRGTSVNTANGWIKAKLDEFDREPRSSERIAILASVSERMAAIAEHVQQLESASASARSKDEDKQKLDEILSREEYQKPEKGEPSLFERLVTNIMDWLRNLFPSPNISPVEPQGVQPLSVVL